MARKIVDGKIVVEISIAPDGTFDVANASLYADVSRGAIRKGVREGTLKHSLVGKEGAKRKVTRIAQKDLDQWLIDFPPGTRSKTAGPKLPYRAKRIASVRGWVEAAKIDAGQKKIVLAVLNDLLADAIAADEVKKAKEAAEAEAAE